MAIVRWDPFKELNQLRNQMDRIFEDLAGRGEEAEWGKTSWYPAVDIFEMDNEIVLKADLPGVDQKDLEIKVEDDTLILQGEKKIEQKEEKENFLRAERIYGAFKRSFSLPQTVDKEKIKASLKNGVLTVLLPKKAEVKAKEISIKVED